MISGVSLISCNIFLHGAVMWPLLLIMIPRVGYNIILEAIARPLWHIKPPLWVILWSLWLIQPPL